MIWIFLSLGLTIGIIYSVYNSTTTSEAMSYIAVFLLMALLFYIVICGFGSLFAGAISDPVAIETNTYYFTDTDDQYLVTATNDKMVYFNYTVNNPHPTKQRVLVKNTFVSKPEENELPHVIEYKYDFASPALRFIFWNPYESIYEFVIDKEDIDWKILN